VTFVDKRIFRRVTDPTTYHFTGQREDSSIGLYDYGARYYDPYAGRFIAPDTLVPNPKNPQDLNRYSYLHTPPVAKRVPDRALRFPHQILSQKDCKKPQLVV